MPKCVHKPNRGGRPKCFRQQPGMLAELCAFGLDICAVVRRGSGVLAHRRSVTKKFLDTPQIGAFRRRAERRARWSLPRNCRNCRNAATPQRAPGGPGGCAVADVSAPAGACGAARPGRWPHSTPGSVAGSLDRPRLDVIQGQPAQPVVLLGAHRGQSARPEAQVAEGEEAARDAQGVSAHVAAVAVR